MTYTVRPRPWGGYTELHIYRGAEELGVTQVRTPEHAEMAVREWLELSGFEDAETAPVVLAWTGGLPA